jgi:hypothetical protein
LEAAIVKLHEHESTAPHDGVDIGQLVAVARAIRARTGIGTRTVPQADPPAVTSCVAGCGDRGAIAA